MNTDLKDVVADVVDLNNGRVALAQLGTEHASEPRGGCDKHYLVSVEHSTLHTELDITQLCVVNELGVNPGATTERRVSDTLDWLPTKTR